MGLFDFIKDVGEEGPSGGSQDEELAELTLSNKVIRKVRGAGLRVDDLKVDVDGGTATLRGRVPDQETRERAVVMAGNTPGVARVDDRLDVEGGGTEDFRDGLYTVEKGDTLSGISEARYGDPSRWKEIFEANRPMLDDPDRIYPGQVLRVPGR